MVAMINKESWSLIFWGLAVAAYNFWQVWKGKIYGRYGRIYTRDENPVAFWFQISFIFGISIFAIIMAICQWR